MALSSLIPVTNSHAWPERINRIGNNGTLLEPDGYSRNFVPRDGPGSAGVGGENVSFSKLIGSVKGAPVCMPRQQTQTQSPGHPRLQASPGDLIAIRYTENGHVTQPRDPKLAAGPDQPHGGPVRILGTTQGTGAFTLDQVVQWTQDGSGGDKKGKLLEMQNYDDGQCYEKGSKPPQQERQAKYPFQGNLVDSISDLLCQNNFAIPADAPIGKPYTILWVWDFSHDINKSWNSPSKEVYSNCIDIDVVAPPTQQKNKAVVHFAADQPVGHAAIPSYFSSLHNKVGTSDSQPTSQPAAPASASASTPPASAPAVSTPASAPPASAPAASTSAAQPNPGVPAIGPSASLVIAPVPISGAAPSSVAQVTSPAAPSAPAASQSSEDHTTSVIVTQYVTVTAQAPSLQSGFTVIPVSTVYATISVDSASVAPQVAASSGAAAPAPAASAAASQPAAGSSEGSLPSGNASAGSSSSAASQVVEGSKPSAAAQSLAPSSAQAPAPASSGTPCNKADKTSKIFTDEQLNGKGTSFRDKPEPPKLVRRSVKFRTRRWGF